MLCERYGPAATAVRLKAAHSPRGCPSRKPFLGTVALKVGGSRVSLQTSLSRRSMFTASEHSCEYIRGWMSQPMAHVPAEFLPRELPCGPPGPSATT